MTGECNMARVARRRPVLLFASHPGVSRSHCAILHGSVRCRLSCAEYPDPLTRAPLRACCRSSSRRARTPHLAAVVHLVQFSLSLSTLQFVASTVSCLRSGCVPRATWGVKWMRERSCRCARLPVGGCESVGSRITAAETADRRRWKNDALTACSSLRRPRPRHTVAPAVCAKPFMLIRRS